MLIRARKQIVACMKDFKPLYTKNEENIAAKDVKSTLLIYVLLAVLFVALCATFIVLYVVVEFSVYVCYAVNFLASVAFFWYTVTFFAVTFPIVRDNLRFYRVVDNAQLTMYRGKYLLKGDAVKEGRLTFISVQFATADGNKTFLIRPFVGEIFREGAMYDLQAVGNKLMAYKEFNND